MPPKKAATIVGEKRNYQQMMLTGLEKTFDFENAAKRFYDWREKDQKVLGSIFKLLDPVEPVNEFSQIIEFVLRDDSVWSCGPMTRFQIAGIFEVNKGAAPTDPWEACTATDVDEVVVQPNWLESCFRNSDIFHGHKEIKYSDEDKYISPFLNAYLYNYMDPQLKQLLCVHKIHTGNAVPSKRNDWIQTGEGWKAAGTLMFGGEFETDLTPLQVPFLYQNSNYLLGGNENILLPIPIMDKLKLRIILHEHQDHLFKKKDAASVKKYRFRFTKFQLFVERLRLSKSAQAAVLKPGRTITWPGCTRIMKSETIVAASQVYTAKFQNLPFPEGIFIFTVSKDVLAGNYHYQTNTDGNVFMPHHITNLNFAYDNQKFFVDEPNIGNLSNDLVAYKSYIDLLKKPPFGIKQDRSKIVFANPNGHGSPYPHVYVNLTNYGDKSRVLAYNALDGSVLKADKDLEIHMTFDSTGATANVSYIFYFFYTDKVLSFNTSHKIFTSEYVKF